MQKEAEDKSSAELDTLIEETLNDDPAKTTLDILKYVKQHKALAVKNFGKYVKYFEDYFDVLNKAIFDINYSPKKTWPQYKSIQYLLFPETLKTLHRAFEDTLDGYYDEAIMLLRSVYEAYFKMIFIIYYPKDYEAIFHDQKGRRNFNLTNFVRDTLKLDWKFIYSYMSKVYHAKTNRVLERLVAINQKKSSGPITLEFKYDEDDISRPINISTFLLYVLFHLMLISFKDDFDNSIIDKKRIILMDKIDKALRGILESLPNKLSSIVKDIDKIDRIIEEVNCGGNWKELSLVI